MKNSKGILSVLGVLLVGGVVYFSMRSNTPAAAPVTSTDATKEQVTPPTSTGTGTTPAGFKDGTYSATGSYDTPAGTERLGVTLTLKDGVITDASVDQLGRAPESRHYQQQFAAGFKTFVIGKKIDQVSISRVSGSSLTSEGFTDALKQIEVKAQS